MPSSTRSGCKVLITSGPTSVPIDDMRVITNRSTGEMGRRLAAAFSCRGARVTLLEGMVSTTLSLPAKVMVRKFYFFDELKSLLKTELASAYDVVVHAAAVSDFKPAKVVKGKVSSDGALTLALLPTVKLLNGIKKQAPGVFLVGFKFEPILTPAYIAGKIRGLFDEAGCDIVVANKQNAHGYEAFLAFPDGTLRNRCRSKEEITGSLINEIYHSCPRRSC